MGFKNFFLPLLLVAVAGGGLGLADVSYRSVARLLPSPDWTCQADGPSCRDCGTWQMCIGTTTDYVVNCRDQNPLKPWCSPLKKECVADKTECNEVETDYMCTFVGRVPHATDCRKYLVCQAVGKRAIAYHCLYNSIYDSINKYCATSGVACYSASAECAGKSKVVAYRPNPSFYVVCQGSSEPKIRYCGSNNLQFNLQQMKCVFVCKREGIFEDHLDPEWYYICVRNGTSLVAVHSKCPTGSQFEKPEGQCVEGTGPITTTNIPGTT